MVIVPRVRSALAASVKKTRNLHTNAKQMIVASSKVSTVAAAPKASSVSTASVKTSRHINANKGIVAT